ncbi:glycosyltransferase family 39 protein [Candidatus Poribacteria bacterium]|nr:glycosyltransferase family 39 protein [Candidatus Poribacteria bacterium]
MELAQGSWHELFQRTAEDTHPPLYYVLVKLLFLLTPDTLAAAQMLSVAFSVGTIGLVFLLTEELFGRRAAWFAAVFASVAPYQVYWGHAARNHVLLPLCTTAIVYFTYRFFRSPSRRVWAGAAAAWTVAIQTNYMALFFGLLWGGVLLLERSPGGASWRRRFQLAASTIPGLLLFLPWVRFLAVHMDRGPMHHTFRQETVSPIYLYFHSLFGRMEPYQPNQNGVVFWLTMCVFAVIAVTGARAVGRRWSYWLLLLGAPTLPLLMAVGFDWTLAERHLLFSVPFFMAYWGACCSHAVSRLSRPARVPDSVP